MDKKAGLFLKVLSSVLCILIGIVFIFSGISKIPTLEQFGWTIVETTPLNWTIAEWSARLLIGLELFLGVLFIAHLYLKKIAIPLSYLLLLVFTAYLLLVIKAQGRVCVCVYSGNCGCFGEVIQMTPLESVYKNIAMLIVLSIIYCLQHEWKFKYALLTVISVFLASLLTPFVLSPPESIYVYEKEDDIDHLLPLSILYQSDNNEPPKMELRKGKHIISFISLTCEYCRKAAKRIRIMRGILSYHSTWF